MKHHHHALLATSVFLQLLCSCTDQASIEKAKALQVEIDQLTKINADAQGTAKRLQSQIDSSRQERDRLKEEKARLEADREAAQKELEQVKKQFESYKAQYKLSMRQRAPGMHIADFAVNGTQYHNVVLKELGETSLNFSHDAGVGKLDVTSLPEALQDLLGINIKVTPEPEQNQPAGSRLVKASVNPRLQYDVDVAKAEAEKNELMRRAGMVRAKIAETKQAIFYAPTTGASVSKLKKAQDGLEQDLLKLEKEIATAEMRAYEVRKNRPLPVSSR